MTPDRWPDIERVFLQALASPPDAREAVVEAACGGDALLAGEVRGLLDAADDAEAYFERPSGLRTVLAAAVADAHAPDPPDALGGARLGPWRVEEEVGRGGMGTVYRAERVDGLFEQTVAIKVVTRGMDTDAVLRRFQRERAVLAGLRHPRIARLLDGGTTPDGRPYLAMEYVEGEPITAYCDRHRLPVADRVRLALQVCEAVAYAHRNLVVHRDLKPSNVLVAEGEGGPSVKLLDFGLAKLLDAPADAETALTAGGPALLTPEYAAPEQVASGPITTATDVYALGVVVYELMTGRRPYAFEGRSPAAVERTVRTVEPVRPSTAAGIRPAGPERAGAEAAAAARSTAPAPLRRQLRGDLDAILLRALRKEPEARYASVEAFADDLRRHLEKRPVRARRGTARYRAAKFVRRHRLGVLSGAGAVGVLLAFVALLTVQTREATAAREEAVAVSDVLVGLFRAAEPGVARGDTVSARTLLDRGTVRADQDLAGHPAVHAAVLEAVGRAYVELGLPARGDSVLRRALALRLGEPDPDDGDVGRAWQLVGEAAYAAGRYPEAERAFEAALRARRADGDPVGTADALNGRGAARIDLGRLAEAEADLREAWDLRARSDPDNPILAQSAYNVGFVLRLQGRLADAERQQREALALSRRASPPGSPDPAHALVELGRIALADGRPADALAPLREAVALRRAALPPGHWLTGIAEAQLGRALRAGGRAAEGEALMRAGRDAVARTRGPQDPLVRDLDAELGADG